MLFGCVAPKSTDDSNGSSGLVKFVRASISEGMVCSSFAPGLGFMDRIPTMIMGTILSSSGESPCVNRFRVDSVWETSVEEGNRNNRMKLIPDDPEPSFEAF